MEQQPDALLASIRFFGKLENRDVSIDDGGAKHWKNKKKPSVF